MAILKKIRDFYHTGEDKPLLTDSAETTRIYEKKRRSIFAALVFGYSFYYVCRLSISVVKQPMFDAGILTPEQMGKIGFALFIVYAFGKCINGFIADHSNIRKFLSTGLLLSALLNLAFGFTTSFVCFVLIWGLNGWFQSMGCAPCVVSMSQWFSNKERGTRYGLWSAAHSIGEGFSFICTAVLVSYFGWRWGFWGAGGISIIAVILMYFMTADRPQTYGLPNIADYKDDQSRETQEKPLPIKEAQFEVLKNPYVWILGLSSAFMYVARYGINGWGVPYLQSAKDYSLISAAFILGWAKMIETLGAISSGFVSDYLFKSRRNVVTLTYGLIEITGLVILFTAPSTLLFTLDQSYNQYLQEGAISEELSAAFLENQIELPPNISIESVSMKDTTTWVAHSDKWYQWLQNYCIEDDGTQLKICSRYHPLHILGISLYGFGLGGLLVFLGGLIAVDICSKRATGAAMGIVGMFSYIGAAVQDWISGSLVGMTDVMVGNNHVYNYDYAFCFWLTSAALAVVLSSTLWNVKART